MLAIPQWCLTPIPKPDPNYLKQAELHQQQLTKPSGALGELEHIAIRLAALQKTHQPSVDAVHISLFAADHGIAQENVSAFPQSVTRQMVQNFLQGGATINVLAQQIQAKLEIIDTGIIEALPEQDGLIIQRAGAGTANALYHPAMSEQQVQHCLSVGYQAAKRASEQKAQLFIGGEMGIANTTAASCLYCALLNLTPEQVTGAGTGLDSQGIQHKINIIQQILQHHQAHAHTTLNWLACVGGFEIAALTGAYLGAAQLGIPILLDGFISGAAALVAYQLQADILPWLFLSHHSAEQGHRYLLEALSLQPLLQLNLRLGEASGAALAVPLMQAACALHNGMATFEQAAVATKAR